MSSLVITTMLFMFTLILALFQGLGKRMDNKYRRLEEISGKLYDEIDEELSIPFVQRFFVPALYGLLYTGLKFFSRLFSKNKRRDTPKLERDLRLAGIKMSISDYLAAKFMFILGIIGVTLVIAFVLRISGVFKFLIILAGMILSILGPSIYLSTRIKNRQGLIRNQMPDVMDLVTVCVEAGLGFDAALLKIDEHSQGPLVDELIIVQREIQMGLPRREALKKFADRNSVSELKTFVGGLIQADQLGLPIKNVLRAQSAQLRLTRKQIAEEKAMKAPIKMMLPLVVFIFPVIFIVLLGPTVLQTMKTFGG